MPADSLDALAAALASHLAQHLAELSAGDFGRSLLNAEQAGALLGVPATWVLAEARARRIPHVRLGHYVRFEAAALEHWWRERARGPGRGPI
jgi:excisionase family DNA binding protein